MENTRKTRMGVLDNLEPKAVFKYFEEICNIPHASYHEEAISDYLVRFAVLHGLEYYQDDLFNVVMIKEATPGYENVEPIIIQGHMDMVAEKEPDCAKDMLTEGLDLMVEGDFVSANGTTLGGDDGIAVAMGLAILADDSIKHPRIEFVCTVSEEVGMEGAAGVDLSMLKGHTLLNLDSEEEGYILTSCAGGGTIKISLPVSREIIEENTVEIAISNLTGGHSGAEIHRGRANATMVLTRLLTNVYKKTGIRIVSFEGGSKDNAIPREAKAVVAVSDDKLEILLKLLDEERKAVCQEFSTTDPEMKIDINVSEEAGIAGTEISAVPVKDSVRVLTLINALPNGVIRMSQMEGLTETSLNLGVTRLEEDGINLIYCVRSNVGVAFKNLTNKLRFIAEALGAKYEENNVYPAWEYRKDSPLRDKAVKTYEEMFGETPVVTTMHAGVECGLLGSKISNLDAISIGPNLYDIHTPQERLSISSTKRMYDFVLKMIEDK